MPAVTGKQTTVDVRGEICPYPMLKAKEAMEAAAPSEVVVVLTDHPPALTTVPWQAQKLGFRAEVEALGGSEWRIVLVRTDADKE